MMLWITLFISLFGAEAMAKDGRGGYQIDLRGDYVSSSFALDNSNKASFSGFSYGVALNSFLSEKNIGLGWRLAYSGYSLENSANGSGSSEELGGSTFALGARLISQGLYIGVAALYVQEEVTYSSSTAAPYKKEYSGIGARIETGMNLPLSRVLVLVPAIHYDIRNLRAKDGSSRRSGSFFAGLGIGIRFE